ncbi:MAG: bile acid:sodium symporter family protein [Muribaculaceae bacterium]
MLKLLQRISSCLAAYASWFVIGVAVWSLFFPDTFGWVQREGRASVILGIIMLTMGCTLTLNDFKVLARRPMDIAIGAVAQYTIMPLVAWTLTRVFGLNAYLSVGIVLVGCCPGGVSSNIMSYLCKGDVAFSVGMTTVSTILAPFVTPLLVLWLAGTQVQVNAIGMFQNILMITLIPVIVGFLFNHFLGSKPYFNDLQSIMPAVSVSCLCMIVGGVIHTVHPQLMSDGLSIIAVTMAVVFCHNTTGYALGYMVGKLFHFNTAKKRTLSIEVGMQNAGMATVLANNFFATQAAIAANPMSALSVVPCALSCAYHSISGTILAGLFNRFGKSEANRANKLQ